MSNLTTGMALVFASLGALNACGAATSDHVSQMSESIDNAQYSRWDSVYRDDRGTFAVRAIINLNGDYGTYSTDFGDTGTLEGIRYAYLTSGSEPKVGVYGTWRLGVSSGGFTFRIEGDGQTMFGDWAGANQTRGTWNGFRL